MIRYSRSDLARAYVRLHDRYPTAPLLRALASELVRSHRTVDATSIVGEIARHLRARRHTLLAQVISARPLTHQAEQNIKTLLAQTTGAKIVRLEAQLDRSLLGGFVVRTPDLELDASVAGKLKHLAKL